MLTFAQVVCEVGKAVGAEGLVAGQIVDIKSEGMAEQVMEEASSPFRSLRSRCNELISNTCCRPVRCIFKLWSITYCSNTRQ